MGGKIQSFTDLQAWQEAHKLVLEIYKMTKSFPDDERFGLSNQMRRAAVSITSNIAEGFRRFTYKEKSRFYSISAGSLSEIQNQLLISRDVGYINGDCFKKIANNSVTVSKLLQGLIRSSRSKK